MAFYILLGCLFFSILSTGSYWYTQLIHYPLFKIVGPKDFNDYYRKHNKREWILAWLPNILAGLLAFGLISYKPFGISRDDIYVLSGLILGTILVSAILILPQLKILSQHGYSYVVIQKLVYLNWFRTILWTLISGFVLWLLLSYVETLKM